MDTERPSPPPSPYVIPGLDPGPMDAYFTQAPRLQKFRHRYRTHIILLVLTFLTTSFAPAFFPAWAWAYDFGQFVVRLVVNAMVTSPHSPAVFPDLQEAVSHFTWATMASGVWYSVPLLTILSAHEFGHYFACRVHNVDATLPYFLPAPLPLTGTLGAVIRIREPFPSKRALFDIGVAGPIAGFLALLPFLYFGMRLSDLVQIGDTKNAIFFGDPLALKAAGWLLFGAMPDGYTIQLHPMGFAAWFGMLATALNLMPFGQLDGGHIAYSLLGRRSGYVSLATLGTAMVLTMFSPSWIMTTVMMLVMAIALGLHHPRIADEATPLDPARRLVAALALVIFILCFTPFPIQTFFGR